MTSPVLCVIGTRPEAVKLAPVISELRRRDVDHLVLSTGQHRELVDAILNGFGLESDIDLEIMTAEQSPTAVAARVLERLEPVLQTLHPSTVLVQGDTTTVMATGIAAAYAQVSVAHLEAGLRTGDRSQPFPEEHNRVLATAVADLHFAPTWRARNNLLREGVSESKIVVTGNTVIDALLWARDLVAGQPKPTPLESLNPDKALILMTAHRRESHGARLEETFSAVRQLVTERDDTAVLYPVHPSPAVREPARRLLGDLDDVALCDPLGYRDLVSVLDSSKLVLTDSGGIQEEAPAFGKPVLVLRDTTERPEAVESGVARLVGTSAASILNAVNELLDNPTAYAKMAVGDSPYGDGLAAGRVVAALQGEPLSEFSAGDRQALKVAGDEATVLASLPAPAG
ncbi:MAG: non-hydrolyzing UDP-N-acetylglucosamine 2-epimerase [Acidimicrobiales bacterium]